LADTIISAGLIIDGSLESESSVHLDGQVFGRVSTKGGLELGPNGEIRSDVRGARVSLAGSVFGNVEATERVDLLAGSRLTGDVRAPRLTIADGASFRGKVDMSTSTASGADAPDAGDSARSEPNLRSAPNRRSAPNLRSAPIGGSAPNGGSEQEGAGGSGFARQLPQPENEVDR